jgi:ACR3 family arsenite efflux pump ArsB
MGNLNKNIKKLIILVVPLFLCLHIYWFFSSVIKSADFKYKDDEATTLKAAGSVIYSEILSISLLN